MRKTKIICTLGPAVDDINTLRELILNGMDCARLNFSHGSHEEQKVRMDKIKQLRKELNTPTPILLDTKGPEIRIRDFENGSIFVEKGQRFTFSPNRDLVGNDNIVGVTYPHLAKDVKVGTNILVDDGKVSLFVQEIEGDLVHCVVANSGKLSNKKSINIPNANINIEFLSEQDKKDIAFGVEQDVDYIAASFVRSADDLRELRSYLASIGGENIKIISKIENMQGINNLDEIVDLTDGVMVARGDMGVEVPFKELPHIQKEIIKKCYQAGKYVVTATQMLESMTSNPRPTRAEVSDVANAIYDGTTAIMLSGETAAGKYPVEAVAAMSAIAETTEKSIHYEKRYLEKRLNLGSGVGSAIGNSACTSAMQLDAKAIIAVTKKGLTANTVSAYRPSCPIIAATLDEKTYRQLNLCWNVLPIRADFQDTTDALFAHGVEKAMETGLLSKGDTVVIVGGSVAGDAATDVLKIQVL